MRKVLKYVVIIPFLVIIGLFIVLIGSVFLYHQLQLSKEYEYYIPPGKVVEVNGHQMHVYEEGEGEQPLIFLAGGGTSSPVLDFKSLYSLLSDTFKTVVVEKAGYGFSEITDSNRDIDTILSETREALKKADIKGPYILVPHSMSGIEALYWAERYPDEVQAIIGLDMAVPAAYEELEIPMPFIRLGQFIANTGLIRLLPILEESAAIKYGTLSEEEKDLYEVVFYRRTSTTNMMNEVQQIKENARTVDGGKTLTIPMLLFVSNGEDTGWDKKSWVHLQRQFVDRHENRSLIELDASHYIHNIEQERIAEESIRLLENID